MARLLHTAFLPPSPSLRIPRGNDSLPGQPRTGPRTAAAPARSKIREIFMPALSSTMTEGKIVSWVKSEGDRLARGESVVVVESDKADMDVETFYDGYLAAIMVEEGGVAAVGSAIALLAETEDEIAEARSRAGDGPPPSSPPEPSAAPAPGAAGRDRGPRCSCREGGRGGGRGCWRVVASPYAKKLAKELKIDLGMLAGSGPMGRIVAKDVEAAASVAADAASAAAAGAAVAAPVAAQERSAGIESGTVVPFTTMQGAVSRNMVESLSVPTFRVGYTITTDALDALYKKIKSKGVTMSALLAKATALAWGLITPVLQDADKVDIYSLSRKWKELVDKARAKQLQPHEYNTGTFTLSNLGMFGVDRFDAILPLGTGAIMAVGASQPTVVATKDGRIGMKNQMQVNVTADHRVIYGADLAQFLQTLANIIEDPKDLTF
ncbi:hypothetical protein NL676_026476 [Syzygium grande]|nr:hypothetical protein NL676_026476 [Syzygium grande]